MQANKVRNVWYDFNPHFANRGVVHDQIDLDKRLATLFCPGPFYYFVFDFGTYTFAMVSESYKTIIGLEPTELTIDQYLGRAHPDDVEYLSKCERVASKFLFEFLKPQEIPNYKVSYPIRFLTANNTYKLFLRQSVGVSFDESGRMSRVYAVDTDISHITTHFNRRLSLIGLNGEPSYTNIDVFSDNATDFKPAIGELTPREVQVLRLLAEGATAKEIADMLSISELTVKKHRENLLRKTKARNVAHMVALGIKNGLI